MRQQDNMIECYDQRQERNTEIGLKEEKKCLLVSRGEKNKI
jgi:hypothetical protein